MKNLKANIEHYVVIKKKKKNLPLLIFRRPDFLKVIRNLLKTRFNTVNYFGKTWNCFPGRLLKRLKWFIYNFLLSRPIILENFILLTERDQQLILQQCTLDSKSMLLLKVFFFKKYIHSSISQLDRIFFPRLIHYKPTNFICSFSFFNVHSDLSFFFFFPFLFSFWNI